MPARLPSIEGQPPDPAALPPGCAFAPRCAYRFEPCEQSVPPLASLEGVRARACFYAGALNAAPTPPA